MSESAKTFFDRLRRESSEYREAWEEIEDAVVLAKNVIRLRVDRGLTQKELADQASMSQPRIAEIESGQSNPTLDTLRRVAKALGTRPSMLLEPKRRAAMKQFVVHFVHAESERVDFQDPILQRVYGSTAPQAQLGGWEELERFVR